MKESNYGSRFKGGSAQAALTELTEQSITAGGLWKERARAQNLILALQHLLPNFKVSRLPAAKERQLFFLFQERIFDTKQKGRASFS